MNEIPEAIGGFMEPHNNWKILTNPTLFFQKLIVICKSILYSDVTFNEIKWKIKIFTYNNRFKTGGVYFIINVLQYQKNIYLEIQRRNGNIVTFSDIINHKILPEIHNNIECNYIEKNMLSSNNEFKCNDKLFGIIHSMINNDRRGAGMHTLGYLVQIKCIDNIDSFKNIKYPEVIEALYDMDIYIKFQKVMKQLLKS
jgi:hypothetical protein